MISLWYRRLWYWLNGKRRIKPAGRCARCGVIADKLYLKLCKGCYVAARNQARDNYP